jgi:sirohydrochlorin cobaltochelatase
MPPPARARRACGVRTAHVRGLIHPYWRTVATRLQAAAAPGTAQRKSSMQALILFAHGARDARWSEPLFALASRLSALRPELPVRLAYLELQAPRLPEVVAELAGAGVQAIAVAPVFWSAGAHVREDLPRLVSHCAAAHGVRVQVLPVLSELPGVLDAVAAALLTAPALAPPDVPREAPPA